MVVCPSLWPLKDIGHECLYRCLGSRGQNLYCALQWSGITWEMLYIALPAVCPLFCCGYGPYQDLSIFITIIVIPWVPGSMIQLYSETNQEAYDNFIQAFRIAEHMDVKLPVMVCQDGFITSHAIENIQLIEDEKVKEFVGEYTPEHYLLNRDNPIAVGPLDMPSYYFEHKYQQHMAMEQAKRVILEVAQEFEGLTGRKYGFFEEYRLEDADIAVVVLNSTAGTAKAVVDQLRDQGVKAGLLKIRMFRPFPAEEIKAALQHVKAVAVMDKSDMFATTGGPVFNEVRSAMYDVGDKVKIISYIYGLGGKDVRTDDIQSVYENLATIAETGKVEKVYNYLGIRE